MDVGRFAILQAEEIEAKALGEKQGRHRSDSFSIAVSVVGIVLPGLADSRKPARPRSESHPHALSRIYCGESALTMERFAERRGVREGGRVRLWPPSSKKRRA